METTTTLLVADDHAVVREGIRSLLRLAPGFAVVAEADDGEDAVAMARLHAPDVVLLDLMMPGIGGVAATRSREKVLGNLQTLKVSALGEETLAGVATRKYKVDNSQPNKTSSTFWVAAATGYPVQAVNVAEVGGKTYTSTLKYSRYNDPSIKIQAPPVK